MLMLVSTLSLSQSPAPPPAPMPPDGDPLKREFFPPELIMDHQRELGVTADQRKKLVAEIQAAQSRMVELQFEVKSAHETLADLVRQPKVDEAKAMAQVDKLMAVENEIKKNHLRLLVRIKNLLSAEQQGKLREMIARLPPPMPQMPQPPQPPQR
jgi:Spy/CpxP family protein refolding chaperone